MSTETTTEDKTASINAVNAIRNRNPHVRQRTLAHQIVDINFEAGTYDYLDACDVYADFATVYGRIRRYDKARAGKKNAIVGAV